MKRMPQNNDCFAGRRETAKRLKSKPYLARCPNCGGNHRVSSKGYIHCTQVVGSLQARGVGVYRVGE